MKELVSKKILVTGASGMTGAALVLRLAEDGHQVVAFSRSGRPVFKTHPNITWNPGDVQDREALVRVMTDVEEVYHLAAIVTHWAPDLRSFYRTNVQGTINVLETARQAGVRKIVVTTSVGVIGPPDQDNVHPIDENNVRTIRFFNDYEASKAMVHERIQDYVRAGMNIVLVLPSRIWGPGPMDPKNSVTYLLSRHLRKQMVTVPGTGKEIGNFVHLDDAVDGHILAMRHGRPGERYFIGGQNMTMDEITGHFSITNGRKARVLHLPFGVIGIAATIESVLSGLFDRHPMATHSTLKRLTFHCPISIAKAQQELGFEPMSFEKALRRTQAWLETADQKWPVVNEEKMTAGVGQDLAVGAVQAHPTQE